MDAYRIAIMGLGLSYVAPVGSSLLAMRRTGGARSHRRCKSHALQTMTLHLAPSPPAQPLL